VEGRLTYGDFTSPEQAVFLFTKIKAPFSILNSEVKALPVLSFNVLLWFGKFLTP
jgi:hypothetical protein